MKEFWQELFRAGLYKPLQGRVTRQATFVALAAIIALGVWRMSQSLDSAYAYSYVVPAVVLAVCLWVCYRFVNLPSFADFLISVQAEMNKVSWPGRGELFRSSLVVIFTIFFLAGILFFYDLVWQELLTLLRVLPENAAQ